MKVNFDAIPVELKSYPNWVLWRSEKRNGKVTKIPYQPGGLRASSTDPKTWGTFEVVKAAIEKQQSMWGGIGFVLEPPFVGLDFDQCIGDDGQIKPEVATIIQRLNSYSEKSPSGKGIHLIAKGSIPKGRKCAVFEIYQRGRYFTMTGNWLERSPLAIEDRHSEILEVYQESFGCAAPNKEKSFIKLQQHGIEPHQPEGISNQLVLRLERHGNIALVIGPKHSYSGDLSQASQNQAYFDLLIEAVEAEYEETMVDLKVLTREQYMVRAITKRCIRRDADALAHFLHAAQRFKAVLAENTDRAMREENELALMSERVKRFVTELQARGISCQFDGIINGNFARISLQNGFFDVYATRRRSSSEPHAHCFADFKLQQRIETLWREYILSDKYMLLKKA